jgi:hypothetical protein
MSFLALFLTLTLSAQAASTINDEDLVILDESESKSLSYSIKEIKAYTKTLPQDQTCLDDYLLRRKRLLVQTIASPAIVAGGAFTGAATGLVVGSLTYSLLYKLLGVLSDPTGGWQQLGYMIGGGVLGGAGSGVYALTSSVLSTYRLIDSQRVLKAMMEAHQNEIGVSTQFLFQKFKKHYSDSQSNIEDFSAFLLENDKNGTLCDGSKNRLKKRLFKKSLKYKISRSKDIFYFLNKVN